MNARLSNNINVYYERIGVGRAVLLLHGFTLDHKVMKGCMEPVFNAREVKGEKWERYYLDLPNMGKSKNLAQVTNSDIMLGTVLEFIDKIIGGQHLTLVGFSYGAYLAMGLIYRRVPMIDGLAMICPVIIGEESKRDCPAHITTIEDTELTERVLRECDEQEKEVYKTLVVQSPGVWERCRNEIISGMKKGNSTMLDKIRGKYPFTFEDEINKSFDKPTLILTGKQDSIVGYKDAKRISKQYSNCIYETFDGAGHALPIEQEDKFNISINEWLDRLKE